MPKRIAAVDDRTLMREVGQLADEVLLLPRQVAFLTGLSVDMLAERMRTRPPKPPFPEPREKPRAALWYSLGAIRAYRFWLANQAEARAMSAYRLPTLATWLERAPETGDRYPFALVGFSRRPVDIWLTIRGEVAMGRGDRVRWLMLHEFERERTLAANYEHWWDGRGPIARAAAGPRKHRVSGDRAPNA